MWKLGIGLAAAITLGTVAASCGTSILRWTKWCRREIRRSRHAVTTTMIAITGSAMSLNGTGVIATTITASRPRNRRAALLTRSVTET